MIFKNDITATFIFDCTPHGINVAVKTCMFGEYEILFHFEGFEEKLCQRVFFPDFIYYYPIGAEKNEIPPEVWI